MKRAAKLILVLLAATHMLFAAATRCPAQVPYVWILLDGDRTWLYECKAAATLDTLDVVGYNFNAWFVGFDVQIYYPPALLFIEDQVDATLWLGQSPEGLAIVWQTPRNGFASEVLLFRSVVIWTGNCSCVIPAPHQPVVVKGYPGNVNPTYARWPDYVAVPAVGLTSLICADPPISVEETTWGRIKALFH